MTLTRDDQLQLSFTEPASTCDGPRLGDGSAAAEPATPPPEADVALGLLLTTREAARALRISRSTLYQLLAAGRIESVRIGTSRRVPAEALAEFVARLRASSTAQLSDHHASPPRADHRRDDDEERA